MDKEQTIQTLQELGLNNLEAEIYLLLLGEKQLTGYKIAKKLGKAVANIYKALEALQKKGAVISENIQDSAQFSACPIQDFLAIREQEWQLKKKRAEESLKSYKHIESGDGVNKLESISQVLQSAKNIINSAQVFIAAEIHPFFMEQLRDCLADAAKRGVKLLLQVYEGHSLTGENIKTYQTGQGNLNLWNAQLLCMGMDRKEAIIVCLDKSGNDLYQALHSRDELLSNFIMSGVIRNLQLHEIVRDLHRAEKLEDFQQIIPIYAQTQYQNSILTPQCQTKFYEKLINKEEYYRQLEYLRQIAGINDEK